MAHPYDLNQSAQSQHDRRRSIVQQYQFHFIIGLLLAAVVLVLTLAVRSPKPTPQPSYGDYGSSPATAPR